MRPCSEDCMLTNGCLGQEVTGRLVKFFKDRDEDAANKVEELVLEEENQGDKDLDVRELVDWSPQEVGDWVAHTLQLPKYADMFVASGVDGMLLLELDDDDLEYELRVDSPTHRDRILAEIKAVLDRGTLKDKPKQRLVT
jgi:hypothetical protein